MLWEPRRRKRCRLGRFTRGRGEWDRADYCALPKLRIRFYDRRHAAATFLLAQGFTLEDVKNLLGHSSIVLTSNTYGHVLEQRQRQVARAMDAALGG